MIKKSTLIDIIIKPSLLALNMYSDSALNLMLGTYAVESDFCSFPTQINGPALSWLGIERETHDFITLKYLSTRYTIRNNLITFCNLPALPSFEYVLVNAHYSCMISRLKYYMNKEELPNPNDIEGLAHYWKKYYNSVNGKGTVDVFLEKYERYVLGEKQNA